MDQKLFENLRDLYAIKFPWSQPKLEGAYLRENALGFVRLCESSGKVLLKIKKEDVASELQCEQEKSKAASEKEAKDRDARRLLGASVLKTHAGLEGDYAMYLTLNRKEIIVAKTTWSDLGKVVRSAYLSECLVEEVRTEQKKSMSGSIAKGIAFGWMFGGVGAIAGATSGNYENVLFKLIFPDDSKYLCEAKQELFKTIYSHSKEFA